MKTIISALHYPDKYYNSGRIFMKSLCRRAVLMFIVLLNFFSYAAEHNEFLQPKLWKQLSVELKFAIYSFLPGNELVQLIKAMNPKIFQDLPHSVIRRMIDDYTIDEHAFYVQFFKTLEQQVSKERLAVIKDNYHDDIIALQTIMRRNLSYDTFCINTDALSLHQYVCYGAISKLINQVDRQSSTSQALAQKASRWLPLLRDDQGDEEKIKYTLKRISQYQYHEGSGHVSEDMGYDNKYFRLPIKLPI